jgi:uncharacterized Zn finger protein (UPF0148 family)
MRLCTNCGFKNPDGSSFCVRCGSGLASQLPLLSCPSCGAPNIPKAIFCDACGKRISPEILDKEVPKDQPPETLYPVPGLEIDESKSLMQKLRDLGKPFWAGVLLIIGGILDIASGIVTFNTEAPSNELGIDLSGYLACCAALTMMFGTGAIFGGILSCRKEYFYFVLVGAIMGMLGVGFLLGFLLSFIAMILVATSRDEYGQ